MFVQAVYISLGAILGALSRWGVGLALNPYFMAFPLGTLIVNLLGCFVIGIVLPVGAVYIPLSIGARAFLITGLLGSFTTFSTFSAETIYLFITAQPLRGILCVLAHVVGGLIATYLGILTTKAILHII
ncbi:fluoride efflux transporter CrcB [Candidatus Aerophobetes bacterium]|uniref:Fluoride-specific ion channel FluC n=1 Tax=Aerophobetes bacterium TaxID=2030807 RepID=A0A2A4YB07_UNCAE|nr:MAG: fluoride efflux transporter CrcB [Candidatus Aerophobetes bacterium]